LAVVVFPSLTQVLLAPSETELTTTVPPPRAARMTMSPTGTARDDVKVMVEALAAPKF